MLLDDSNEKAFKVFLWEQDPRKAANLVIVTCADRSHYIGNSYAKADLLAWKAMESGKPQYQANKTVPHWGRYKSVAAFPIFEAALLRHKRPPKRRPIAGLSVKSLQAHRFHDRVNEIYRTLKPALSLMTLAVARSSSPHGHPSAVRDVPACAYVANVPAFLFLPQN